MGTGGGAALHLIFKIPLLKRRKEIVGVEFVDVFHFDLFVASRDGAVDVREFLIEVLEIVEALLHDDGAVLGELLVPELEVLEVDGGVLIVKFCFADGLEEGITLFEDFLVLREGLEIVAIDLGEEAVEVVAAEFRAEIEEIEVFGCKEHGEEIADVVTLTTGDFVMLQYFLLSGSLREKYFQFFSFIFFFKLALAAEIVTLPLDEVFLGFGAKRAADGEEINSFEKISFALTVWTDKDSEVFFQVKMIAVLTVAAKIF